MPKVLTFTSIIHSSPNQTITSLVTNNTQNSHVHSVVVRMPPHLKRFYVVSDTIPLWGRDEWTRRLPLVTVGQSLICPTDYVRHGYVRYNQFYGTFSNRFCSLITSDVLHPIAKLSRNIAKLRLRKFLYLTISLLCRF